MMMKSVMTPEIPKAQVTGTMLMQSKPGACTEDTSTGMHCSRNVRKKLIIHAMTRPITAQFMVENDFPMKILLYSRRMLHLANPSGKTWKVKYVKCV